MYSLENCSNAQPLGDSYSADLLDLQRDKDAIDPTSRICKVRLRQTFFKMKYKECFVSQCWSHTLSIILGGFTALQTSGLLKNKQQLYYQRLIQNIQSFSSLGGLRASSLEAPGLHYTNLNTRSTQTPRGQELLGHIQKEWQII